MKKYARRINATRLRLHLRLCSLSALFELRSFAAVCGSPQRQKTRSTWLHLRYTPSSALASLFAVGAVRVELVRGRLRVATA